MPRSHDHMHAHEAADGRHPVCMYCQPSSDTVLLTNWPATTTGWSRLPAGPASAYAEPQSALLPIVFQMIPLGVYDHYNLTVTVSYDHTTHPISSMAPKRVHEH
jgi:hypothetical protein